MASPDRWRPAPCRHPGSSLPRHSRSCRPSASHHRGRTPSRRRSGRWSPLTRPTRAARRQACGEPGGVVSARSWTCQQWRPLAGLPPAARPTAQPTRPARILPPGLPRLPTRHPSGLRERPSSPLPDRVRTYGSPRARTSSTGPGRVFKPASAAGCPSRPRPGSVVAAGASSTDLPRRSGVGCLKEWGVPAVSPRLLRPKLLRVSPSSRRTGPVGARQPRSPAVASSGRVSDPAEHSAARRV